MIKTNKVKLEIHYDHINRDYDLYRIQPKQTDDKDEEKCVLKRSLEKLDQLSPVLAVLYRYDHINRDYDLYRIQPKQTDDKDEEKCVLKRSLEKLDQLSPVLAVLYRYGYVTTNS